MTEDELHNTIKDFMLTLRHQHQVKVLGVDISWKYPSDNAIRAINVDYMVSEEVEETLS